jgi:hypothetical protein
MRRIIFYSWQSDLPNATNRTLILKALENAAKAITIDETVDVEPVIDRDTQGVPGAPDISKTIFNKLASADVVVADVSIIATSEAGRRTPNPNVLIEVGYALRALGDEKVVLVLNTAFGAPEELPFDLKMRRAITYDMPESSADRSTERKLLEAKLEAAMRSALAHLKQEPQRSPLGNALEAVRRLAPDRAIAIKQALAEILARLDEMRPKSVGAGATAADLEDAVVQTEDVAHDFAQLAEIAATMNDEGGARVLYRGLGSMRNTIRREELGAQYTDRITIS